MAGSDSRRRCEGCGRPLSQYNPENRCQACVSSARDKGIANNGNARALATGGEGAIGQRLATLRRECGLTQEQLAESAGLSPVTVAKLEQGAKNWARLDTLTALACALNTSVGELVEPSSVQRPDAPSGDLTERRIPGGNDSDREARAMAHAKKGRDVADRAPNIALRRIREHERHETRSEFAEALAQMAREMGESVHPSERYVARLEDGDISCPRPAYRRALVALCRRPLSELGFTQGSEDKGTRLFHSPPERKRPAAGTEVPIIPSAEEEQEEMERRRLLQSLAALGVQASPLNEALETVRTVFGKTVGYDDRNHIDSWEEAVTEYGYSYISTSPLILIPDLAADLVTVRSIIRRVPREDPDYRAWGRVGGALSALMAKSLSNLGQPRESRQWWEMAQHLADMAGDLNLGLWLRGQRIIHALYENRPVPVVLRQVEAAVEYSRDYACAGLAEVSAGGAQVSVLSGDHQSAVQGLHRAGEILNRLPSNVTKDTSSVMGWGEAQLRYTEAWVYSHMGDEAKTDRAADRALQLYPHSDRRSPAQIGLMRAFARIQSGNITEGIQYARAVYEPLVSEQCTTMVDALARRVLISVPAEIQGRADVAEYRALIAPATRKMIES